MEWIPEEIRIASFKGVEFRCVTNVGVKRAKRFRSVEYTNRPGGLVWDGARKPVTIELTAIFLDDEYPWTLEQLIEKCDEIGPGTLVHPTRGEIWALCTQCDDDIAGETPNQASLKLSFIEAAQGEQAWEQVSPILNPEARAETLASSIDAELGYSGDSSFGFHVAAFLAILALPSLTRSYMDTALSTAVQGIRSLADAIDTSVDPLRFDYIAEAYLVAEYCIEAADLYAGNQTTLGLYLVQRDMTLLDVAAETGASEDEILRYNSVGDPLTIPSGTFLVVPT